MVSSIYIFPYASTRFFGTDFSFEDLDERDVDQYDYVLLGEESIDERRADKARATGHHCFHHGAGTLLALGRIPAG